MDVTIFNPSKAKNLSCDKMATTFAWGMGEPLPRVGEWVDMGGWWRGKVSRVKWSIRSGDKCSIQCDIFLERPAIKKSSSPGATI